MERFYTEGHTKVNHVELKSYTPLLGENGCAFMRFTMVTSVPKLREATPPTDGSWEVFHPDEG